MNSYPSESINVFPAEPPKLFDRVRDRIRHNGYSIRVGHTYVDWIKRFIPYFGKRHPYKRGAVSFTPSRQRRLFAVTRSARGRIDL